MKNFTFILSLAITIFACNNEQTNSNNKQNNKETIKIKMQDSLNFVPDKMTSMYELADTLYYTAQLKAANEEEALYMNDWVKNLKLKEFSEMIFKAVNEGKLTAYKYGSDIPMTKEEVKKLRKENKNSEIGKILFEEAWYFDEKNMKMYKKVRSIMLAYERKNSEGEVKGYKSGIKVYFK